MKLSTHITIFKTLNKYCSYRDLCERSRTNVVYIKF